MAPMSLDTPFAKKLSDLLHPGLGLDISFIDADVRIMALAWLAKEALACHSVTHIDAWP